MNQEAPPNYLAPLADFFLANGCIGSVTAVRDRLLLAESGLPTSAATGQMLPPAATDQSLHRIPSKYSLAPSPRGKQGAQQAG